MTAASRRPTLPAVLHIAWAALGVTVSVVLIRSRGGHPPGIVLLPPAWIVWAAGHGAIWGSARLARRARSRRNGGRSWAIVLTLALSGLVAFVLFWWIAGSWLLADGRQDWLAGPWLWLVAFLPWLAHAACFLLLLGRRPAGRPFAAALWLAWALVLSAQVARELLRYGVRDPGELALALVLIAVALAMAEAVRRSDAP